ncbi:glycerol-3-phosphate acyltransferase RAM2-like [Magnolia sinica]|uniref:glycerol-3-phosphate acyltransferase RAM2-like n=1 Tax=Magnolia sinica TaxID=86752 RepID=UPI002658F941|nr:glycerol-3-phosphate acyltransferase RAM2-like [Magnolia sinica]
MFPSISKSNGGGRENHTIVTELDGTLLISRTPFPYFMLVAFEAGGPIRALMLLLISPIIWVLEILGHGPTALQIMIFVAMAGLRVADIKAVAKAVLPRFYLDDIHGNVYKMFSCFGGKKYVVSSMPKIMIEPFVREYLDVDHVIGTDLRSRSGYCIGLPAAPGIIRGAHRLDALRLAMGSDGEINVGLGSGVGDHSFMWLCQEGYVIPSGEKPSRLDRNDYPKPLIFHDGRFVLRPTPLDSMAIFLWLPLGILLAISRLLVGNLLPYKLGLLGAAATGLRIRAKFSSRDSHLHCTCHSCDTSTPCTCGVCGTTQREMGTLYVCSHRTLIDPVIVASTLQRRVTAVTYSVSRLSEILSPIRTVRLRRDRAKDGEMMRALLMDGDLVVCPEGTTCREPYLLRFSPLFAEIADAVVPVAVSADTSMFYGTTVRGYKWLDSFFFLMNPRPNYRLDFLQRVPVGPAGMSLGRSSYDVANHVQEAIARVLGYQCTSFTRRDKYRMLAGNDDVGPTS